MHTLEKILSRSQEHNKSIVLPEGDDPRVIDAAVYIAQENIATVHLISSSSETRQIIESKEYGQDQIVLIDATKDEIQEKYAAILVEARQHKGLTMDQALTAISQPLVLGACMVRSGFSDGMVAGAAHATADVVRAGLQIIGMNPASELVSSFFIMEHQLSHQAYQGTAIYADCAMVIDPNSAQLASIAIDTAQSAVNLIGIDPTLALLSFSTAGSAQHANVDKVRDAGRLITSQRPDLKLMTEVQFDAAIIPEILKAKAPDIGINAPANIFIFPDLQSGNIGYKIAQRIGGVQAIGPVLQGLQQPINDLSRGCSVDDIINLVAVTSVQSGH